MKRRELRARAVQAIYQMDVGQVASTEAVNHVLEGSESQLREGQREFVLRLAQGVGTRLQELDDMIGSHVTGWRLNRIAKVDLAVLRLALYELLFERDTDVATIMDEAVELAKEYSTEESGRFINGALAKLLPVVMEHRGDAPQDGVTEGPGQDGKSPNAKDEETEGRSPSLESPPKDEE